MITTRHMHLEVELVRWLLLIAAAIAIVLALANAVAGADPMTEPRQLPNDMGTLAKPILPPVARPVFPDEAPIRPLPPAEAAARIWMIFDNYRTGDMTAALAGWEQVRLPEEAAHWRELARAAAYLRAGDLEQAELRLERARMMVGDHPLAAYFMGLVRLEQAVAAIRLPDRPLNADKWLVGYTPAEDRAALRAAAVAELQLAITAEPVLDLHEPLVAVDDQLAETFVVPRVHDLLAALDAENFVAKAHHTLFGIYLDDGELALAEYHLGEAGNRRLAVLYGYRDLGEAYLERGDDAAAARLARREIEAHHPLLAWLGQQMIGR